MLTDLELINKVKDEQDNFAISELVNRHSGIYLQVVNKYCSLSSGKLNYQDLSEDKLFNIYKYAQTFNPDKECKFPTYIANMTRYTCLDALKHEPAIKEYLDEKITEDNFQLSETVPSSITTNETLDFQDLEAAIDKIIKDKRFKKIVKWRHPEFTDNILNWEEIGKRLGLSNEGARKIYMRNIKKIKKFLKK